MFAPVIGAAYTMTTKREAHWSEQTKAKNTEKGMSVGLKQPRGDGQRYVTAARAAAKETTMRQEAEKRVRTRISSKLTKYSTICYASFYKLSSGPLFFFRVRFSKT